MSWKAVLIAASITPLAGCRLFESAARNLVNEPLEYLDERKISHQARADANRIWQEVCAANPERTFTKDFANGFKEGYADYLDNGGPGVPPPLPPRYYQRSHYLNPEGHALIRDWFAGFQHGIDIAKETGKRGYLTVPVLLQEPEPSPALQTRQIPSEECAPDRDPRNPGRNPLPKPKPVDPATGLPAPERPGEPKPVPLPAPTPIPQPIQPPAPAPNTVPVPVPGTPFPSPAAPVPMAPTVPVPKAEAAIPNAPSLSRNIVPVPDAEPAVANANDSVAAGKYSISPVNEGLRVIVRPVQDSSR